VGLEVHDERLIQRVGAVVLLVLAGLVALLIGMQRCSVRENIVATVYFEHPGPLREGADVQVAGRIIGKVESISLVPGRRAARPDHPLAARDGVAVRIRLQARFAFMAPLNGTYFISAKGVMGERYLEIGAPSYNGPRERPLASGDEVRGVDAPHLDRTLWHSYLSMVIAQGFLEEIAPQVHALMRVVKELTATLEQMNVGPRVQGLVTELEGLSDQARATLAPLQAQELSWSDLTRLSAQTELTLARTRALIAEVRARAMTAGDTLARIDAQIPPDLMDRVSNTLATVERSVERAEKIMATLGELVAMIDRGQGTVGALLNDPELFDDVKVLGKALKNSPWRVVAPPPADE
jgi:phospholipid/cholesterol/gamma-HCH transport system substrate-binding protein